MGEFKFSYFDISRNGRKSFSFNHPDTANCAGKLNIIFYEKKEVFTHFDYIKKGTEIALVIGTDFTSSNKHPDDPLSLHSLIDKNNPYRKAMNSVG